VPDTGPSHVRTYCRICESACGLVATVQGDRLLSLAPDPDHPLSKGYACIKGTRFAEVHHHPDRVLRPQLRSMDGLADASWEEALKTVGGRLRTLLDDHGPRAVGIYSGNAAGHSLGAVLGVAALQRGLATPRHYACLTLDNAPMFVVAEEVFGNPMITFTADYDASDCVVLLGTDPLASQPSQAQSHPDGVRAIVRAARGGGLIVIDPRRSITARKADLHLAPRPGSDVDLLAHLVRGVLQDRLEGQRLDPRLRLDDVTALAKAVAPYDEGRAASATGLTVEALRDLLDRLKRARTPLVWSGLGVLLGPEGTLGWWLTLCLQAALGGLNQPGGWRFQPGGIDLPGLSRRMGLRARDPDVLGRSGKPAILGTLAAADLADDILDDGPDRLRALIVVGGNPLAALPDTAKARRAFARLDLLVCIDLFVNATGRLAHAVLPARSWAAREDVAVHMAQQRPRPHLQLARAIVPPVGEAREDWTILLDLCRAAGRPAFGTRVGDLALRLSGAGPTTLARLAVAASGPLRWRDLIRPEGAVGEGSDAPLRLPIRLAVPEFVEALGRRSPPSPETEGELRLVTSVRPPGGMNSWMWAGRAGERTTEAAHMHPVDAQRAGVAPGGRVELRGAHPGAPDGSLVLPVVLDPTLRPGVVVVGYGAVERSPNHLVGTRLLEAFTGQPCSNGLRIRAIAAPDG
jgi:formate dehydrogenase